MAHSQPTFHTANIYDIPTKKSANSKNKYQRSLPMSQRIENLRRNGKKSITNPPAPTSILIKSYLPQISNSIEIYECLANPQQNMPSATQKWIQHNLCSLNSVHKPNKSSSSSSSQRTPPAPHPSASNEPVIPTYKLPTDLKLNHKYYDQDYFVSVLNIITAACIKYEFLSNEFMNYISRDNVQQLKQDALKQFTGDCSPQNMNKYAAIEDIEQLFLSMFNKPDFIMKHSKAKCSQNLSNLSNHRIDGMDAYKPLFCTDDDHMKYITLHSFSNPASADENIRNQTAAEFNSVCEALRANKDKIGLSIFYSVNFMDPLHPAWFYIVKFKEPTVCDADMPHLETGDKSKKSQNNHNKKKHKARTTIVIDDDDDDFAMNDNGNKPKHVRSDKEENDDKPSNNAAHHEMNGNHHKNDNVPLEDEANKISHSKEHSPLHLSYDETQANRNNNNDNVRGSTPTATLSDTVSSETRSPECAQRISSQPRIPATVSREDAVGISMNCNTEQSNDNNDDLEATFVSVDDEAGDNDNASLNLMYAMSDTASPKKRGDDLPETALPDTMMEHHSENNHNHLPATVMVDEDSLALEMDDDTVDDDDDSNEVVVLNENKNGGKSKENIEEMSPILNNDDDEHNNHNNKDKEEEYVFNDLEYDLDEKESKISGHSSDESHDLSAKQKKNKKEDEDLKIEELDKKVDIAQNELQQMIESVKGMGIDQGLIEFILKDIDPNPKDINIFIQQCFNNMEYYNDNKKKMERKQKKKKKQVQNVSKRGKKRKRNTRYNTMDEAYDVEDDEEEEELSEDSYAPRRKKRRVSPRISTRSRRSNKKRNDLLIMSSDEGESENENTNNRNKNKPNRQTNKKNKRSTRSKKKKQAKLKHTKATESKMLNKKNFMNGDIFKSGKCRDFQSITDTESDADDMEHHLV